MIGSATPQRHDLAISPGLKGSIGFLGPQTLSQGDN